MMVISNHSAGTIGGTVLAIVWVVDLGDMAKTAILAMVGAVVSYVVSAIMKKLFNRKIKQDDL